MSHMSPPSVDSGPTEGWSRPSTIAGSMAPLNQDPAPAPPSSESTSVSRSPSNNSRGLPPLSTELPGAGFLFSPTEPASKPARNIILLLDGTGQEFSKHNSNIIKLMSVLKADEAQRLYYSSGLGTVLPVSTGSWARIKKKTAKAIDLALAWNFDDFVCDAYKFLMDTHRDGDRVYLFGFSRGAYVARALAGMLQKVGLLPPRNHNQIKTAYRIYVDPKTAQIGQGSIGDVHPAALYRRIFGISRPVVIEFLGAWDTVSSLGGIGLPKLPFAGGVRGVKFFRQAFALDERRARFVPEYRHYDKKENELYKAVRDCERKLAEARKTTAAKSSQDQPPQDKQDKPRPAVHRPQQQPSQDDHASPVNAPACVIQAWDALVVAREQLEKDFPAYADSVNDGEKKRRLEVWFMGSHLDVGGGIDLNDQPSLSNIPFRWMLREAVDCGVRLSATGIAFLPAIPFSETLTLPSDEHHRPHLDPPAQATIDDLNLLNTYMDKHLKNVRYEQDHRRQIEETRARVSQVELAKVVRLAAARDACDGPVLSDDAKRPVQKSLKRGWWLLEGFPLQSRRYTQPGTEPGTEEGDPVWKMSLASPRQMVPGQKVHRSVFRRLQYEESLDRPQYGRPAARVGDGFPAWEEALRSGDHRIWQP